MCRYLFILLVIVSGLSTNSHLPVKGFNQIKKVKDSYEESTTNEIEFLSAFIDIDDTSSHLTGGNILINDNKCRLNEIFRQTLKSSPFLILKKLLSFFLLDLPPPVLN